MPTCTKMTMTSTCSMLFIAIVNMVSVFYDPVDEDKQVREGNQLAICEIKVEEDLNLAVGCRFSPYDCELILHYLLNKILDVPLPMDIITEIDLYQFDPDQLPISEFKHGMPGEAYFFTHRQRKYSSRSMSKRNTKTGYWKVSGVDAMIFHKKLIVGFKKTMVFYWGKAPTGIRSPWIMHEFRVNPILFPQAQHNETLMAKLESYVVCRIRSKNDDLERKNSSRVRARNKKLWQKNFQQ